MSQVNVSHTSSHVQDKKEKANTDLPEIITIMDDGIDDVVLEPVINLPELPDLTEEEDLMGRKKRCLNGQDESEGAKKKVKVMEKNEMTNEFAVNEVAYSMTDNSVKKNTSMQPKDVCSRFTKEWEDKIKGNVIHDELQKYYAAIEAVRQTFTALTKKMLVEEMSEESNGDEKKMEDLRDNYLATIEESFPEDNVFVFGEKGKYQKKVVEIFNGLHEVLKDDLEKVLNNIVLKK